MGRFYAIVFLLAACGDNEQGTILVDTSHRPAGAQGSFAPGPREVPQICGSLSWDAGPLASGAVQVSVVGTQSDVHVLAVPVGGGALEGFTVDTATKQNSSVAQVPASTTYHSVGINQIANHLVMAGTDGLSVHVTLLDDQLASPIELGKVPGTQVVPQGMLITDGARLVPIATATSIGIQEFDSGWNIGTRRELGPTTNTKGFAATQFGSAMLLGWSTPDSCYLATVYTLVGTQVSQVNYPCPSLQIAGNVHDGSASVLFEAPDGIHMSRLSATNQLGGSELIRAHGTAPRAMTDNFGRTWISYLDERGDVVVGFPGADGEMISTAMAGIRPNADAYGMTMFDGAPWVFAVDGGSLTATRMCVAEQQ